MGADNRGAEWSRRNFLGGSVALGAMAIAGGWRQKAQALEDDLGVASGDPMPSSVVLWTRVPGAFQEAGDQVVFYEVSGDPDFGEILSSGQGITSTMKDHCIRVRAGGLASNTWYYYRFYTESGYQSVIGRTRTAPGMGDDVQALKVGFVSCQLPNHGYYNVYKVMAEDDLDLVLHLGDNVYEHGARSLEDFRANHRNYLGRADLREVRRLFPWIHIWDDHEVYENYAGTNMNADQRAIQAASYQAFSEYMPMDPSIQLRDRGDGIMELPIHRNYAFGDLLEVFALDGRQYRSEIVCGDDSFVVDCQELQDPSRTMLGRDQTDWLKDALSQSESRWKLLANNVVMMEMTIGGQTNAYFARMFPDTLREGHDGMTLNADQWDGFPANRSEILTHVAREGIENLVVCTGDMHNCYAGELKADFSNRHRRPSVGVEFVGGSVTSNGFGEYTGGYDISNYMYLSLHTTNPHVKYCESYHHCYTRLVMDRDELRANYVFVSTVLHEEFDVFESPDLVVPNGRSNLRRDR